MIRLPPGRAFFSLLAALLVVEACGRTGISLGRRSAGSGEVGGAGGVGGTGGSVGGAGGIGGAGGMGGGTCSADFECDDGDPCTTDSCEGGACTAFVRDDDGDGAVALACGGDDCNDKNPNARPGLAESCADAADNDCNGVADCLDPACSGVACGCVPSGAEDCANGADEDCDATVDCNDADCIGTPACGCAATEVACDDGIDDDCDGALDCADTSCAASKACQCQATFEDCGNGKDDDCDLLVDCADPSCKGLGPCACTPPGIPEACGDFVDNDCDGKVDCADPSCVANLACKSCQAEDCDNGKDDDCDGVVDCADDACVFAPGCEPKSEACNNDLDDDKDGATDCDDTDCAQNPLCASQNGNCLTAKLISGTGTYTGDTTGFVSKSAASCGGGAGEAVFSFTLNQPARVHLDSKGTSFDSILYVRFGSCGEGPELACDDDSGGKKWAAAVDFDVLYPGTYYVFLDGFTIDPNLGANEGPYVLHVEIEPNPTESSAARCVDGKDNDGDVYIDCGDASCASTPPCATCNGGAPGQAEFGVARCTNGVDDDCDGKVDAADSDCDASPFASPLEDCDGKDQNDNGIPDDFSCRCATDADCAGVPGYICYTRTIRACGPPCFQFFGNVCPSVAPGTSCNQATGQCEF